jgi:hypothetical protein
MTRNLSRRAFAAGVAGLLVPSIAMAQRRRGVVVRRNRIVVRPGHPIRRAATRDVVVHSAHKAVVVTAPLVFLPVVAFTAVVVALPPKERLIWQDTETIARDEDWVESNFGIEDRGDALYLQIEGSVQLDFADVTYENGEVQVVDFNEGTHGSGIYRLYQIPGVRNVKTVRLVARARSNEATLRLYLNR